MTVALNYAARRLAASMVALCILAALLSSALQSNRQEHAANGLRTAAPAQFEFKVFVNCNIAALANSADRTELMSLCWRRLIQTADSYVFACIAWLDAVQTADWRAARLLFNQILH